MMMMIMMIIMMTLMIIIMCTAMPRQVSGDIFLYYDLDGRWAFNDDYSGRGGEIKTVDGDVDRPWRPSVKWQYWDSYDGVGVPHENITVKSKIYITNLNINKSV